MITYLDCYYSMHKYTYNFLISVHVLKDKLVSAYRCNTMEKGMGWERKDSIGAASPLAKARFVFLTCSFWDAGGGAYQWPLVP